MNTVKHLVCLSACLLTIALRAAPSGSLPPYLLDVDSLDKAAVTKKVAEALRNPITTVVDKKRPSPTGDAHDYVSYGRYWWPDPSKSNGLPYIQLDGHPNREMMALGDHERLDTMITTIQELAQSWYLEQREDCARRAGDWIRAWFVTPTTRMNPSFEYAQIRLGQNKNHGSNSGLIDTRSFTHLVDALRMLHGSPAFTAQDEPAVRKWLTDYILWLTTSKNGKKEHEADNNHGTWYLTQVIAITRYLDREEEAHKFAIEDLTRIDRQFKPDGSQPLEMVRTDGLGYCAFNLEAQFEVAKLSAPLKVDLWNFTAPGGGSLRQGLEFIRPYNADPKKWPGKQLKELKPGFLEPLLKQGERIWPAGNSK